jgi:hypothetical protein
VGSGEQNPLCVHLLIGDGVLHVEVQGGEPLEKGAQERDPRVVVERLDPLAGSQPVLGRCGFA